MNYPNRLYKTILMLLLLLVTNTIIYANKCTIIFLDGITVPIPLNSNIAPPPNKPILTNTPRSTTTDNKVSIEIQGKAGSTILVNGRPIGTISSSGRKVISLDTSGVEGIRRFSITLKDSINNTSSALVITIKKQTDEKYNISDKGLSFYHQNKNPSEYLLNQLNDNQFNALNATEKLLVANKLLGTLFFGYPQKELQEKINSGNFITNIRAGLEEDKTDKVWIENYITDPTKFTQYRHPQIVTILSRFYAMKHLDNYFLKNWIAYVLTQTIMFSPAYELQSTRPSNVKNIYSRIITLLDKGDGIRDITYKHMTSEDNWRRFRSPEDNGREMLEIFHLDKKDNHVPIAAKALKNWKINTKNTLEVGSNENKEPLSLFGTTIVNGYDFYRELVKSDLFLKAATKRLVDFFFLNVNTAKKEKIVNTIVSSHPETWQDVLLQIIFSEEYLLHTQRVKSAEEAFFSFTKKMNYHHKISTFTEFKASLETMHQASMTYKLGKLNRVPLDSLSFINYHRYIREEVLIRKINLAYINDYTKWGRQGWDGSFVDDSNYNLNENDPVASLESFIDYLFISLISRHPNKKEMTLFKTHMLKNKSDKDSTKILRYPFNLLSTDDDPLTQKKDREYHKYGIARIVLDYISRLSETYTFLKVK